MVLRQILLAAALAALPACKQSLFDDNVGNRDGGTADANPDDPDAAGPSQCPDPCIADLTADFDGTPDGSNGLWAYLSDGRDRTWTPMTAGQWMGIDGLLGAGDQPVPAIIDCRAHSGESACSGVTDRLLLVPSTGTAGYHDPAVEVAIDADQQYRVSGAYRSAAAGSDVLELRIYRNTGDDLVAESIFDADAGERGFDLPVEAVTGDRLLLALRAQGTSIGSPVGVQQYLSRNTGAFPGGCGLTLRFDAITGPAMPEDCGLLTYTARQGDGGSGYVDLTPPTAVGATPGLGTGIRLAEDQYLLPSGGAADYSGSFTIQMWVRIEAFNFTDMFLWSDWSGADDAGLQMHISSGGVFGSEVLFPVTQYASISFNWPTDQAWHFLRVVRDADNDTYKACLDGQQRATTVLDGALDLTSIQPPYIGRNVDYNPPYFQGELDDIRFFTRALPCR